MAAKPLPTNLLAALADPRLFGPHFKGHSWDAWKAFLATLFASPMDQDQLAIFRDCTGRMEPPTEPFTEAALIVGRRGGKSRVLALIAVYLACFRNYTPHLAPGEVATIAVLAANRAQARSIFRFVSGLLKHTPLLKALVTSETADQIELANRVVIEISTASFRTTRGYSFAAVLCDEIAFWRQDETSANPDTEILRALRPGMASIPGSVLLLASSPYAKRGELYKTFRKNFGKDNAKILVWKAPTETMNPRIDPQIIADAYADDPEAARAEYGAEFRDDLADYVTREVVEAVTCPGRTELLPARGVQYFGFVDPSGGLSDSMTLAISHRNSAGKIILDAIREVRPPFDPEATVKEFAELCRAYAITSVTGDRYGGEWPRQRFRENGIDYQPSDRPKSELYLNLLPLMMNGRVELLEHPRLVAQLTGLERKTARSGRDSVDHGPGGHDDISNAVAGALVSLDLDRRPALIDQGALTDNTTGLPYPEIADMVFSVTVTDKAGETATVYFSRGRTCGVPLLVLDFHVEPFSSLTIPDALEKLKGYRTVMRIRCGLGSWASALMVPAITEMGLPVQPIPEALHQSLGVLALSAAAHAAAGKFKISGVAMEKARYHPLGGALNFRVGETGENALRDALLIGISLGLDRTPSYALCT